MSLSTISFMGIYYPLLLIIYYNPINRTRIFKNSILLLASLGLYACAEPIYIFLLMASVLFNYYMAKADCKLKRRVIGNIAIIADVVLLIVFKYINPLISILRLGDDAFEAIAFPIGLSYFTFREISYVVESRKDEKYISTGLVETALFICNFMTITAGPLGFYDIEINDITGRTENKDNLFEGIYKCIIGLIKKVIVADSLKNLADACFSQGELSMVMAWIGAIAYTLEIYFDFSGYADMALGVGKTFGFKFMQNFDLPYTARSISEFWKKWHISLTKWFTRYIYIPLGGSKVASARRHIFNLWVVWMCTGIWHGSNWTFILWGMIYFTIQVIEKYTNIAEKINKVHLGHIYTMLVVVLCWVIFRSDNLFAAFKYIKAMFGVGSLGIVNIDDFEKAGYYIVPMAIGALFSSSFVYRFNSFRKSKAVINVFYYMFVFLLFVAALIIMIARGYTAPLYAGF